MDAGDEDDDDEKVCIKAFGLIFFSYFLAKHLHFYMPMNRKYFFFIWRC